MARLRSSSQSARRSTCAAENVTRRGRSSVRGAWTSAAARFAVRILSILLLHILTPNALFRRSERRPGLGPRRGPIAVQTAHDMNNALTPFRVTFPDEQLDDLRRRLAGAR